VRRQVTDTLRFEVGEGIRVVGCEPFAVAPGYGLLQGGTVQLSVCVM
jgi:hypothetical protein